MAGALGTSVPPLVAGEARWLEVQSPHFVVRSDGGEKVASRVARQFEVFRAALRELWPWARVDPPRPPLVWAARNEASLRQILPSLPERASGVFLSLGEQHMVVLRTDLPVPRPNEGSPYHVVYHEYAHLVLDLNFEDLPLWIHEGVAEFLSGSFVEGDGIEIGRPIPRHRRLLREKRLRGNRLMPVAELFAVTRSSPTYDEGDRASLFYAESWALVHCLMQANRGEASRMSRYLERRREGETDESAGREAWGETAALQGELEGYVQARLLSRRLSVGLPDADEPSPPRAMETGEVRAGLEQLRRQACASGLGADCDGTRKTP